MPDTITTIQEQIASYPVLLYMKGTPEQPRCGFSARIVEALAHCREPFAYVNVLDNPEIRESLPKFANWPTFPQLWIGKELVGGCDIVMDMHERGELQPLVSSVAETKKEA